MDGWTDGRADGRTDGRTDEWIDGRTDGRTNGLMDGRTDGYMNEKMVIFKSCAFETLFIGCDSSNFFVTVF